LAEHLGLPLEAVGRILDLLVRQGLVIEVAAEPVGYVPARAVDTILLSELLGAIRRAEEGRIVSEARLTACGPVDGVMERVERSLEHELDGETLRDLIVTGDQNTP